MKTRQLVFCLFLLLSTCTLSLEAQVTIGAKEVPANGALLQLKETGVFGNNSNSNKGLGMPRVRLTDFKNLYPMFAADDADSTIYKQGLNSYAKATEDFNHIGLMVYHTDKCSMLGTGLYIWRSTGWTKLGDQWPGGLNLSTSRLDFPSGQDLRTLAAQPFSVSWTPNGATVMAPTWAYQANYGSLNFTTLTPVSGSLTTSPQTMSVLPQPMTLTEIGSNAFLTKERKLIFTFGECNNMADTITINQTNKALRVNGNATSFQVLHTATAINQPISIVSNAQWQMNMFPAANTNSAVTTPNTQAGKVYGTELSNNTGQTIAQTYNLTADATKDRYTLLVFSDKQTPKRFSDIKINIVQCTGTTDPTMLDWSTKLGTAQDEIAPNGVAWHKDQDGNIFLSMNYDATNPRGSNNRWMINNLLAKDFDRRLPRTGSDKTVVQAFGPNPSAILSNYKTPNWAYPKTPETSIVVGEAISSNLSNRQRLGLLYNWAAATNSLGGTNGTDAPTDAQGGQIYPAHRKVQGICPNGWHLPSDYDWTELENAIIQNTAAYSASGNIGGQPLDANTHSSSARGSHGKAMLDACEPSVGYGTSNSPLEGGFSVLAAGYANTGLSHYLGTYSYFWSASHNNSSGSAYFRMLQINKNSIQSYYTTRDNLFSVRCKKDN